MELRRIVVLACVLLGACDADRGQGLGDAGTPVDAPHTEPPDAGAAPGDAGAPGCVPWRGVRLFGGALDDEASDVLVGEDGEVLVAGYEDSVSDFARTMPAGQSRGLIRRIARDETESVLATLDAPGSDAIDLLAWAPGGALVAAGRTHGALGGEPVIAGRFDVVGGRVEAGAIVDAFRTGVRADDRSVRLAIDEAGVVHLAGYAEPEIDGRVVVQWDDGFAARVAGGEVRRADAQSEVPDVVLAMALLDGEMVIGGAVQSGTVRGPFVSRLDETLRPVWSTRLSPVPFDAITALAIDDAGDVVAVGAGTLSGETGQDVVVYRLSGSSGAPELLGAHGGVDADFPTDAVRTERGELVIVGETLGGIRRPVQGDYDVFVMWIEADGMLRRVEELGSAGDDRPAAIALDACGTALVAGYASGRIGEVEGRGGRDALLVALGE